MKKLNDSQKELLNGALDNIRPEYLAEASVSAHDGQTRHTAGAEVRKAVLRWVCVAAVALLIVAAMVFASLRGDWLRQRFGGAGTENPGGLPTPSGANSGTEHSVNPPVPVPSSALPTGDEAKALQDFCAPKYDSKDTRHVDVFLEILARDGNKQSDGTFDKSYNYQHAPFYNVTPESIRSEVSDLEFFYNGNCLFMLFDGVVYKYSYWKPEQLCLWDYDGDGILELVSYGTIGSGIIRLCVSVLDLETMKSRPVYSSMLPYRYSFLFYNGIIYLGGYPVTYEDGEFRIDPAASRVIPEYAAEYTKQDEN